MTRNALKKASSAPTPAASGGKNQSASLTTLVSKVSNRHEITERFIQSLNRDKKEGTPPSANTQPSGSFLQLPLPTYKRKRRTKLKSLPQREAGNVQSRIQGNTHEPSQNTIDGTVTRYNILPPIVVEGPSSDCEFASDRSDFDQHSDYGGLSGYSSNNELSPSDFSGSDVTLDFLSASASSESLANVSDASAGHSENEAAYHDHVTHDDIKEDGVYFGPLKPRMDQAGIMTGPQMPISRPSYIGHLQHQQAPARYFQQLEVDGGYAAKIDPRFDGNFSHRSRRDNFEMVFNDKGHDISPAMTRKDPTKPKTSSKYGIKQSLLRYNIPSKERSKADSTPNGVVTGERHPSPKTRGAMTGARPKQLSRSPGKPPRMASTNQPKDSKPISDYSVIPGDNSFHQPYPQNTENLQKSDTHSLQVDFSCGRPMARVSPTRQQIPVTVEGSPNLIVTRFHDNQASFNIGFPQGQDEDLSDLKNIKIKVTEAEPSHTDEMSAPPRVPSGCGACCISQASGRRSAQTGKDTIKMIDLHAMILPLEPDDYYATARTASRDGRDSSFSPSPEPYSTRPAIPIIELSLDEPGPPPNTPMVPYEEGIPDNELVDDSGSDTEDVAPCLITNPELDIPHQVQEPVSENPNEAGACSNLPRIPVPPSKPKPKQMQNTCSSSPSRVPVMRARQVKPRNNGVSSNIKTSFVPSPPSTAEAPPKGNRSTASKFSRIKQQSVSKQGNQQTDLQNASVIQTRKNQKVQDTPTHSHSLMESNSAVKNSETLSPKGRNAKSVHGEKTVGFDKHCADTGQAKQATSSTKSKSQSRQKDSLEGTFKGTASKVPQLPLHSKGTSQTKGAGKTEEKDHKSSKTKSQTQKGISSAPAGTEYEVNASETTEPTSQCATSMSCSAGSTPGSAVSRPGGSETSSKCTRPVSPSVGSASQGDRSVSQCAGNAALLPSQSPIQLGSNLLVMPMSEASRIQIVQHATSAQGQDIPEIRMILPTPLPEDGEND